MNGIRTVAGTAAIAIVAMGMLSKAGAQTLHTAEQAPDAEEVVALYPGVAPGSEAATWQEKLFFPKGKTFDGTGRRVRNVVQPTLTVFAPTNPVRSSHSAVIIAPGGGCVWLSIDQEGYEVARSLAARGMTAIVLKYRLNHTPDDDAAMDAQLATPRSARPAPGSPGAPPANPASEGCARAGDDGMAAMRWVRSNAARLNIDPEKIGMMGFSAGGNATAAVAANYTAATRPAFVGLIYAPAPATMQWKADAPPVFLAVAGDDPLSKRVLENFATLHDGQHAVELHIYNKSGHGFGMLKKGLTSDIWIDEYENWLGSLGFLTPAP